MYANCHYCKLAISLSVKTWAVELGILPRAGTVATSSD